MKSVQVVLKFVISVQVRMFEGQEVADDSVKAKDLGHPGYSVAAFAFVVHRPPLVTVAAVAGC